MRSGDYDIQIKNNGIQVGCTFVPLDKMEELVKKVKETPSLHERLKEVYFKDKMNLAAGIEVVAEFINTPELMQIRGDGEYRHKGFFLGRKEWKVVKDDYYFYVLLPPTE